MLLCLQSLQQLRSFIWPLIHLRHTQGGQTSAARLCCLLHHHLWSLAGVLVVFLHEGSLKSTQWIRFQGGTLSLPLLWCCAYQIGHSPAVPYKPGEVLAALLVQERFAALPYKLPWRWLHAVLADAGSRGGGSDLPGVLRADWGLLLLQETVPF